MDLGINGWAVLFIFILFDLIVAWRMYTYTNLTENSPYLVGLEHDGEEGMVNHQENQ